MVEKEFQIRNHKGMWEVFEKVGDNSYKMLNAGTSIIENIRIAIDARGCRVNIDVAPGCSLDRVTERVKPDEIAIDFKEEHF